MTDYSELLDRVIAKTGKWHENAPDDVTSFLEGISKLIAKGKNVNSNTITEILNEEFNFSITNTSVRNWVREQKKNYKNS